MPRNHTSDLPPCVSSHEQHHNAANASESTVGRQDPSAGELNASANEVSTHEQLPQPGRDDEHDSHNPTPPRLEASLLAPLDGMAGHIPNSSVDILATSSTVTSEWVQVEGNTNPPHTTIPPPIDLSTHSMAPEVTDIERYHLRLTRAMTCGDISNLTSTCSNEVHISQRDKDIFLLAATERMRAIIAESEGRETEQADSSHI